MLLLPPCSCAPGERGKAFARGSIMHSILIRLLRDTKVDGKHWTCMPFFWDLRAIHAWVAEM